MVTRKEPRPAPPPVEPPSLGHLELVQSHLHAHDDHNPYHQHTHADDAPPLIGGRHIHVHRHEPMTHRHAHTPDLHHRHGHD